MVKGKCSVCSKSGKLRAGMCVPHYSASWREKMLTTKCKIDGCERGVKCRMMCDSHYRKVRNRELLEKELALAEEGRRKAEAVEQIKRDERKRIILALSSKLCKDCQSERSIHPKCFGLKEAISILRGLEIKNVYQ